MMNYTDTVLAVGTLLLIAPPIVVLATFLVRGNCRETRVKRNMTRTDSNDLDRTGFWTATVVGGAVLQTDHDDQCTAEVGHVCGDLATCGVDDDD